MYVIKLTVESVKSVLNNNNTKCGKYEKFFDNIYYVAGHLN